MLDNFGCKLHFPETVLADVFFDVLDIGNRIQIYLGILSRHILKFLPRLDNRPLPIEYLGGHAEEIRNACDVVTLAVVNYIENQTVFLSQRSRIRQPILDTRFEPSPAPNHLLEY